MKLRTHIALALLVAAFAVPVAHAEQWGIGPNGPAGGALDPATDRVVADNVDRYLRDHAKDSRMDTSDVVSRYLRNHAPASRVDASDVVSRYLRNHTPASRVDASDVVSRYLRTHAQALAGPPPSRSGAGFDWADAGIGAGGIVGIMLLAGSAAFVMRQGRRRLTRA
jgi:hypothetical protein